MDLCLRDSFDFNTLVQALVLVWVLARVLGEDQVDPMLTEKCFPGSLDDPYDSEEVWKL